MIELELPSRVAEATFTVPVFGDDKLPEAIKGQIDKLNELDLSVKEALKAAQDAEKRAIEAGRAETGWSLFSDKKKEAIEELQHSGKTLATAVQSGAKAQKISFEFQARLSNVTKYLFGLGVRNIAANRVVVRELEMRLSGASEEELSDLARQEVLSVVRQLKEQEDLLKKQEQLSQAMRTHDLRIREAEALVDAQNGRLAAQDDRVAQASARVDDLGAELRRQGARLDAVGDRLGGMDDLSKRQQEQIETLLRQVTAQQDRVEALGTALAQARADAEDGARRFRGALNLRTAVLAVLAVALSSATFFLR
ncbi:hypothetical protein [Roseateles sp.]|uniref:hypothetical protein n=1 Tax=Roseateles sp. TaxID=1971397 RepID=UPI0031DD284D